MSADRFPQSWGQIADDLDLLESPFDACMVDHVMATLGENIRQAGQLAFFEACMRRLNELESLTSRIQYNVFWSTGRR
jgi:hypothetical protein